MGDLVRGHGRVADEHALVVAGVLVEDAPRRQALVHAAPVVLPHGFIDEVVEVEALHVLELGARGREQLLADLDVGVHGPADVQEQEHLDGVPALGAHPDVEHPAVVGRRPDRVVHVELFFPAGARELAQAAQRHLDVARAEFDRVVEVLVLALVPHLAGLLLLAAAGAAGPALPGAIAVALLALFAFLALPGALLLLFPGLLERLDELLQTAQGLDLLEFLRAQRTLELAPQPLVRDERLEQSVQVFEPLEIRCERPIELVVVLLVLAHAGAAQEVEVVDARVHHPVSHRIDQVEQFPDRDRDLVLAQRQEEVDQHGLFSPATPGCRAGS